MAQQFVTNPVAPSAQDNLDLLYTNLAENVAYRRAKQQMKAAQKQDLELKMAQGLIPKANITVTDEGFAFEGEDTLGSELLGTERKDTSAAREAFWKAVGAVDPQEDLSKEGGTTVTEQRLPEQEAEFMRIANMAQEAAENRLTPEERAMVMGNYANASQMLGTVAQQPSLISGVGTNIPTVPVPSAPSTPATSPATSPTPNPTPATTTTSLTPATPPPPGQPDYAAMVGVTATPQTIVTNVPAPAAQQQQAASKQQQMQSGKIAEMGQVEVGFKRGGFEAEMANVAQKTTTVQNTQIDEIKRSIPRLAGLAALENYGNQMMQARGYNAGAPAQNTFSALLDQRVKDLDRWEKASTAAGTQQTLEKLDPYRIKVGDEEANLKVTRKGELAARSSSSTTIATGGSKDDAGVYEYTAADDPNKLQSVEVTGDGKLRRDAAGIAYSKGPEKRNHADGAAFFTNLKQIAADEPIIKGWKVTSNDPSGKLPGVIKLVGPNNQEIAWVWNNKDGIWKLSASKDTEVGPLQLFTGTSFRRKGS